MMAEHRNGSDENQDYKQKYGSQVHTASGN
jgi:hypothetical protein